MDLAAESSSEGGLAIFVAQQALYRRVVKADYMSHQGALWNFTRSAQGEKRALFVPRSRLWGSAACSVELRGTNVSDYIAVDLSGRRSLACSERVHSRGKTTIWEHVSQYDSPENLRTFEQIALEGGFRSL